MSGLTQTPQLPYFSVIFTSERTEGDNGYAEMADEMVKRILLRLYKIGNKTRDI